MTDIVDRLLTAVRDEKQAGGALNRDAAEEIRQLREENRKLKSEIEQLQRIGEPEF
jgi:hypothetical protein